VPHTVWTTSPPRLALENALLPDACDTLRAVIEYTLDRAVAIGADKGKCPR